MGAQAAASDQPAALPAKKAKTAQANSSRPVPRPTYKGAQGPKKLALSGSKVMEANTEVDNKAKKRSVFADDDGPIPEDPETPMPAAKKARVSGADGNRPKVRKPAPIKRSGRIFLDIDWIRD